MQRFDVKSKRKDGSESILKRYERLNAILEADDDASKEYRRDLLGAEIVDNASQRYWIMATMFALHISPKEWDTYSVKERGKMIAFQRLRSIEQILMRHEEKQQAKRDKITGKQSSGKQSALFQQLKS